MAALPTPLPALGLRICYTQHKHCSKQLPSLLLDSVIEGPGPPCCHQSRRHTVAYKACRKARRKRGRRKSAFWDFCSGHEWAPREPVEDLLRVKEARNLGANGPWGGSQAGPSPFFTGKRKVTCFTRVDLELSSLKQCPASSVFQAKTLMPRQTVVLGTLDLEGSEGPREQGLPLPM